MTVWLAWAWEFSEPNLLGAFSSEASAWEAVARHANDRGNEIQANLAHPKQAVVFVLGHEYETPGPASVALKRVREIVMDAEVLEIDVQP